MPQASPEQAELHSGDTAELWRLAVDSLPSGVAFVRSELVWFVQRLQIDNETTPECRMLAAAMKTRSQHVARELDQIDEDARRSGIYPGVVRDLKRTLGFE